MASSGVNLVARSSSVYMLSGFYTKFVLHSKGQNDQWKSKLESIIKNLDLYMDQTNCF
jgi:hypothetical protein